MDIKSNLDYHKENTEKGNLYSSDKDGKPKTLIEKIFSKNYIIIITMAIIANIILGLKNKKIKWNVVLPCAIVSSFIGWFWGIFILKSDPNYPAWLFHPWAILGPEKFLVLEDWIFYPTFGVLFCLIFYSIKRPNNSKLWLKFIFFGINVVLTAFFCSFGELAGKSVAWYFSLPSIILFLFIILLDIKWDIKHYCIMGLIIIVFASIWDWFACSWIHYIPGMAWAQEWTYISFDSLGNAHHSSVFLSYTKYKWAWIFDNPIEITPWFGIAGWNYIYSMILLFDHHINKTKT